MSQITVDEVRRLRIELERDIRTLVEHFETRSGAMIGDLRLERGRMETESGRTFYGSPIVKATVTVEDAL